MNILQNIKKEQLQARKNKETEKVSLLTCLISDIEMLAKNDNCREVVDGDSIKIIKKYINSAEENLKLGFKIDIFNAEKEILNKFLPQQLTEEELKLQIQKIITENSISSIKEMGKTMNLLKEKFSGLFDGTLASKFVKELLGK